MSRSLLIGDFKFIQKDTAQGTPKSVKRRKSIQKCISTNLSPDLGIKRLVSASQKITHVGFPCCEIGFSRYFTEEGLKRSDFSEGSPLEGRDNLLAQLNSYELYKQPTLRIGRT